jgi:hypothetical protein
MDIWWDALEILLGAAVEKSLSGRITKGDDQRRSSETRIAIHGYRATMNRVSW